MDRRDGEPRLADCQNQRARVHLLLRRVQPRRRQGAGAQVPAAVQGAGGEVERLAGDDREAA